MSLPQHIRYGIGGTLSIELEDRPSNAIGVMRTGDGSPRGTLTGTVSVISTVLNAAATRGDRSINVANNANIACGLTVWLQDDPEQVLVRKVSGGVVSLRRPLLYDHVNNATVEGTVVTFTANAAVANTRWWDGHLEINVDGGSAIHYLAVECSDYPVSTLCTAQDLFDVEPALYQLLDDEIDIERLRDMAASYVMSRLATMSPEVRARVYPGGREFSHAVALAAMMHLYGRQGGEEARELYQRYRERLDSDIERTAQTTPRDVDQDRSVEAADKIGARSGRLSRA